MLQQGRNAQPQVFHPGEQRLGLPAVLSALATACQSPLGEQAALAWPAAESQQAAEEGTLRCQEAGELLGEGIGVPLPPPTDAREGLALAERGGTLEGTDVLACAELAQAARTMGMFARTHGRRAPALARLAACSPADVDRLAALEQAARQALAADGSVLDEASKELSSLRHRARAGRQRIRASLDDMMLAPEVAPWLQDHYVALRNERHCLPIQASFQSKVAGIVHGASQSGQTLLIEPEATVTLGNEVAILQVAAGQEERRILALLSEEVAAAAPALRQAAERLAALDVTQAAARLAARGRWTRPTFVSPSAGATLRALSHPILSLGSRPVVSNTVQLPQGGRGLILSGPNAGGKTAVLTACGLAWAMGRRGLPVAAASGSQVPWYAGCEVSLGDGQSLAAGLSSFSAHLQALDQAYRSAGAGWLVLIDEIGAATDPAEGSAIAQATLEGLSEAGASVVVSTHLEALKLLAANDARFDNARMGLDRNTLRPTFRLEFGQAGDSFALDAAERLPMAAPLLARARAILSDQPGQWRAALAALDRERAELAEAREQVAQAQAALNAERHALAARQEQETAAFAEAVTAENRRLRDLLQEELQAFRQQRDEKRLAAVVQSLRDKARSNRASRESSPAVSAEAVSPAVDAPTRPFREHDEVWVATLGQRGEVQSLEGAHATVAVGAMRIRVDTRDLQLRKRSTARAKETGTRVRVHAAEADVASSLSPVTLTAPGRLDVRGLRADAAERALMRALDVSLSEGASELWVVHGHGTGALRAQVRAQLEATAHVSHIRPGDSHEGGDGVTIASFEG